MEPNNVLSLILIKSLHVIW